MARTTDNASASAASANSSITNVAALANVSIATVSRVLSGKRTKDDDIARRVRAAAAHLNYSVNYAASALRSTVTNTIGLVIPTANDPFCAQLLDEIEPVIDVDSQQLLLGIGGDQATQIQRIESLMDRHVDGLIVLPAWGAYLSAELEHYASTLPIVQVGGRQCSFRTSMVSVDENAAMEIVIGHLAERGIASVAYMAGKEISFESAELFTMFHTQMRAHHLATETEWNKFGDRSVQRGFDCAMRLFSEPLVQPEAVVCADDAIAFGVMVALHSLGLRVPEDVLVVGYNDSPIARHHHAAADQRAPAVQTNRLRSATPTQRRPRQPRAHLTRAATHRPRIHQLPALNRILCNLAGSYRTIASQNHTAKQPFPHPLEESARRKTVCANDAGPNRQ